MSDLPTAIANARALNRSLARVLEAINAGEQWAVRLEVGQLFLGALPEALKAYPDPLDLPLAQIFIRAALNELEHVQIYQGEDGVITHIDRPTYQPEPEPMPEPTPEVPE